MPTRRFFSPTPYEAQSLIASRNALHFDASKSQYVRCSNDGRFNVLDSITNFTFSIKINVEDFHVSPNSRVSLLSTINYPGNFYGFTAFIANGNVLTLAYAQNSDGDSNLKMLHYPFNGLEFTNQIVQITVVQDVSVKQNISGQQVVVPTVYANQRRLNVDTVSSRLSGVFSDSTTCVNNQPYAEVGRIAVRDASFEDYATCFVSDLLILNSSIQEEHLDKLIQGQIPSAFHSGIAAFVSFNQDQGTLGIDTVEQFNYAKQNPVTSRHWELVNFTSDDANGTNTLPQTAWFNIYSKRAEEIPLYRMALRLEKSAQNYLTVSDFTPTKERGYTTIIGFALDSDRVFDSNYADILLSKRDSANGKYKVIGGMASSKSLSTLQSISAGYGNQNSMNFNTNLSKPCFIATQESDHVESTNPFYSHYVNHRYFCNGYLVSEDGNGYNRSHGFDEIDGDLYIGCDDLQTVAGRYLDGYLFYFATWKGMLSELQIQNLINKGFSSKPGANEMKDCELFVDFNSVYEDSGVLKLVDRSLRGRDIILNNYSWQDFDADSMDYKLTSLEFLH